MHNYQIIGVIGQGAYGVVLKARNRQTNKLVAIKKFKQSDDNDEVIRKIILRQIKVLKSLSASNEQETHVNASQVKKKHHIVELLQAFKKKGLYYLVFEYYDNNILEIMEKSKNGISRDFIARYIYQLLKGLKFMHSNSYVHRDIKPENLLVNSQHIIKICDMGFARNYHPNLKLTEYVATRWYRSPQLLFGVKYNFSIDVWAAGCLMAELVDGNPLFPGNDQLDQIKQIQQFFCVKIRKSGDKNKLVIIEKKKEHEPHINFTHGHSIKIANLNLSNKYQQKIGEIGVNLLRKMLQLLPQKRITAEQCLKHPFFDEIREQFQQFCENSIENNHNKIDKLSLNQEIPLNSSTKQSVAQTTILQRFEQTSKIQEHKTAVISQFKKKGQNKIHTRNSSDFNATSLSNWTRKFSNSNSKNCAQVKEIPKSIKTLSKDSKLSDQKCNTIKFYDDKTNRTDYNSSIRALFRVKKEKLKEEQNYNVCHQKMKPYFSNLKNCNKILHFKGARIQNCIDNQQEARKNEQKTTRQNNDRNTNLDYYKTSYERISGQSFISTKFLNRKLKDAKNKKVITNEEGSHSYFSIISPQVSSIQAMKPTEECILAKNNRRKSKNQANIDYYHNKLYGHLKSKYRQSKNQTSSKSVQTNLEFQGQRKKAIPCSNLSNRLKNFRTKLGF